jgi:type IV pilus assembly protein PilM
MAMFSGLFGNKEMRALGVDIGSSAIKVVEIKKKNSQAVLETYGELALGPYAGLEVGQAVALPPEKIAQALTDLMNEKEVNVITRQAGLSIPFASSLMSVIEMPEVNPKQLSVMVPLEARKYIPVPISEVMLDWSIIPRSEVRVEELPEDAGATENKIDDSSKIPTLPKIDVLIVAIHNETIARYQEIVSKSGLEAGFFEIEIFSTMRAVLDENLHPVMIVDIGASSTKIYVVERGIIRSSHTINRGSQDITTTIARSLSITSAKAEMMKRDVGVSGTDEGLNDATTITLDYIFAGVNDAILAFERKHNRAISKVVLVGGGSALKGLLDLAKDSFRTEVVIADPFNKVSAPAFLENVLRETGPEFAVAIGLALRRLAELE